MIKRINKRKSIDKRKDKSKDGSGFLTEFKLISFREFLYLDPPVMQQYENTGLLLKPDNWGVSDVLKWDFLTVKETQIALDVNPSYETIIRIIQDLTGYRTEKILDKLWIDVFKFFKFVQKSIERVNELEKKLEYEPDAAEENAGIEMFNQFGYFVTIDRLAGGDPLKYDAIGKMEYSVIFSKLLLNKTDTQFMKNFQKQLTANHD